MEQTILAWIKKAPPFERFSLEHALSTLIITTLAFTFSYYFLNPESYWLTLTAILLSQAGLRNELTWQAGWQVFYYPLCALIAAALIFVLSITATIFWLAAALLFITSFFSTYLGWRKQQFFFAAFLINLLGILAVYSPCDFQTALERIYLMLFAGFLVFLVRGLFFYYQRPRRTHYAWVIFLQKLKYLHQLIFQVPQQTLPTFAREQEENRFQAAWCACLSALQTFKTLEVPKKSFLSAKAESHLERIWELTLSLGSLRYRITDKAILSMSEGELQSISAAITAILDQCASRAPKASALFDFQALEKAIQRLEELYQGMLQTVAPEPLVLLLFIQDCHALKEELGKFVLTNFSSPITLEVKEDDGVLAGGNDAKKANNTASFLYRRSFRSACAVFLALLASHYFPAVQGFWLPVVALLLTQSEMSFPLHQSLQRCLWIVVLLLAVMETMTTLAPSYILLLGIAAVTLTAYGYAYHSRRYLSLHFPLLLMIVMILALVVPVPAIKLSYFLAVVAGAAIGLLATLLIFPDKPDLAFPERVVPLMKALSEYLAALMEVVLREDQAEITFLLPARSAVETLWANRDSYFPVWVFEPGFNPALRPGQYYVVIHLGQITEILFALNHLARHHFENELLSKLAPALRECTLRTEELFSNIQLLLAGEKAALTPTNYIEDMTALEEGFRSTVQLSIELLDVSRDYVYLAALIRYLKDLRLQLLQIASTLR